MEILKDTMGRDRRVTHSRGGSTREGFHKEEASIPVGKHCVRSLFTVQNTNKKNLLQSGVDKAMRDSHNRVVNERKEEVISMHHEKMAEKYFQTEKKIQNIKM